MSQKLANESTVKSNNTHSIVGKLITFPGYAAIFLSWLALLATIAYSFVIRANLATQPPTPEPIAVSESVEKSPPAILIILIGIVFVGLILWALWVFIARWTKAGVVYLFNLLQLDGNRYWLFCVSLLVVGWLLVVGVLLFLNVNYIAFIVSLMAALWIIIGSTSFGIAAAKKLVVPQ